MSQRLAVTVKGRPHEYKAGERYKLFFGGEDDPDRVPYVFHCWGVASVDKDGTWVYSGIGEFDDGILKVVAKAETTTIADELEGEKYQ